ncbi:MAG: zinc-ribbon domain-containing protein [Candidatus Bathyarchaeota archaeon]|nr:zinc-ribbon domain-containing protein [Candidatus Bathyarchaeota archaeon]
MFYCRNCGAKLDEDAKFCRVCGAPVEASVPAEVPSRRRPRAGYTVVAIISIVLLLVAFFVAIGAFFPVKSVHFNRTYEASKIAGVDTVNFDFDADVADVNLIVADLPTQVVKMEVFANGNTGLFGSETHPLEVVFTNQTLGGNLTVTSDISRELLWPFSFDLQVTCNIYLDSSVPLNINAKTSVGRISMNTSSPVAFQDLTLRSTTGGVEANITEDTTLTKNVSLSTTTGSVRFIWDNVQVTGNAALNLATTTGSVNANVTQTPPLAGNVSVNAVTTTGSVNVDMDISGNVGAHLTSHTTTGSISVDVQNFNGDKSPIYSNNYPAASNFLMNLETTTGSVHITATYQPAEASLQEQIRDAAMTYIKTNHPETAQFMDNLSWTGGRVDRGMIVGSELYTYLSGGWNFTMTYPVIPNPIYSITADYQTQETGIPYRVIWEGTWQNSTITEKNYVFAQ